jgi:hypothetical protein
MLTDQNFVPSLSGKSFCLPVIRLEDPSLHELYSISTEIFERCHLPVGTVFMVGSVSFLAQVGSTIYCMEWVKLVKNFNDRMKHCRVGPLPPVLQEPTPPSTAKLIVEVRRWFSTVYNTDIAFT